MWWLLKYSNRKKSVIKYKNRKKFENQFFRFWLFGFGSVFGLKSKTETEPKILFSRRNYWLGISSSALNLKSCFLSDRFQTSIASNSKSQLVALEYGAPGSVLGPLLYSLYTTLLIFVISKCPGICSHFHAYGTQIYISFAHEPTSILSIIKSCIRDLFSWTISKKYWLVKIKRSIFFLTQNILIIQIAILIYVAPLFRHMTRLKILVLFSNLICLWTNTSLQ